MAYRKSDKFYYGTQNRHPVAVPDERSWRAKLAEFGLEHEAFTFTQSPTGKPVVKFWQPDRPEALRILARLDGMRVSP